MLINKSKTQILTISNSSYDCNSYLLDEKSDRIHSGDELKMLGFFFSNKPTVQIQIDKLIRKASKRIFVLLNYKKNGVGVDKLKVIYMATIRSVVEHSSNTYHSQLNKGQENQIERLQKRALKIVYGYNLSYEQLLERSGLETMKKRRERLFEKFARKTSKNLKYSHWFPLKGNTRDTRKTRPYIEERASGDRLYRSPIFAMRRLLNSGETTSENPQDLTGTYNLP